LYLAVERMSTPDNNVSKDPFALLKIPHPTPSRVSDGPVEPAVPNRVSVATRDRHASSSPTTACVSRLVRDGRVVHSPPRVEVGCRWDVSTAFDWPSSKQTSPGMQVAARRFCHSKSSASARSPWPVDTAATFAGPRAIVALSRFLGDFDARRCISMHLVRQWEVDMSHKRLSRDRKGGTRGTQTAGREKEMAGVGLPRRLYSGPMNR
jgi:hypothetical protein